MLTAGAVTSIAIEDPGFGYIKAPFVAITNSLLDPNGVAIASATAGIYLGANGGSITFDRCVPTDAISIFSAGTPRYICRWMD